MPTHPEPVFTPTVAAVNESQLTAFIGFCERATGRRIGRSENLYQLSIDDQDLFWSLALSFSGLVWHGDESVVRLGDSIETTRFFPNVSLSYPENLLGSGSVGDLQPAVTVRDAGGITEKVSRGELRQRVFNFAHALRVLGVSPGDRIAGVLRNDAGAIVTALGSAAVGATFAGASCSMGVASMVSRFGQIDPAILVVSSIDVPGLETERLRELASGLPTLRAIIVLADVPTPKGFGVAIHNAADLAPEQNAVDDLTRYPFNHPLYILFSSGTTGPPKCIVHGAGGTLLEHWKEHVLHGDIRTGDKLFFHTSVAWMMWNWQLSALACGAELVIYDGPVVDPEALWSVVADERVTAFGTSPPFLRMCQAAGYSPKDDLDLSSLRSIMSTGSVLNADLFEWVKRNVGELPLQSISGGTDIVGCFVLGNPNLPVYAGESQCRSFGLDVRAVPTGRLSPGSDVGELVCANAFPSCPLGLYGDSTGERFHETYFSQNHGMWTHGDLIEITPRGTARMHGRSDGTLNVHGIRIGPAEIYSVLAAFPELRECMAVEQPTTGGPAASRMVLLAVMTEGRRLDPPLRARIRTALAKQASPAHVPAVIVDVPELPITHSGKRSEVAVRCALMGQRPPNQDALANPASVQTIAAAIRQCDLRANTRRGTPHAAPGSLEQELADIWEGVLGVEDIGPNDDFFEAGGTSLLTAPLFHQIHRRLGRRLPLSTILHAPTIASMATLLHEGVDEQWGSAELLKAGGTRPPLFIAPGLLGEPLGMLPLAHAIETPRAVYGLRGQGLIDGEEGARTIDDMAERQLGPIRDLQPHGPYSLLGFSLGGAVVVEIARRLLDAGEEVEFVGLIDTHTSWACLKWNERLSQAARLPPRWPRAAASDSRRTIRLIGERLTGHLSSAIEFQSQDVARLAVGNRSALKSYRPLPFGGPIVYFSARSPTPLQADATALWRRLARQFSSCEIPGHHGQLLHEHLADLGRTVADRLP